MECVAGLPTAGIRLFSKEFLKIFHKAQHHDDCRADSAGKKNHYQDVHEEQYDGHLRNCIPFPHHELIQIRDSSLLETLRFPVQSRVPLDKEKGFVKDKNILSGAEQRLV